MSFRVINLVVVLLWAVAVPAFACKEDLARISLQGRVADFSTGHALRTIRSRAYRPGELTAIKTDDGVIPLGKKVGDGFFSVVYCIGPGCNHVVKVPKHEEGLTALQIEKKQSRDLNAVGFRTAPMVRGKQTSDFFLIKKYVSGPSLAELKAGGRLSSEHVRELAGLFVQAYRSKRAIDMNDPANLIWDEKRAEFVLVDCYMPDYVVLGTGVPNIYKWRGMFSGSDAHQEEFERLVTKALGKATIQSLEDQADQSMGLSHAIKAMPWANDWP